MTSEQVYIYPTDTVWGIGCDLYSEVGLQEIARIKKTSLTKPLSLMFSDVDQVMVSFSFPRNITKDWLTYFFSQESTLGVPETWAKIEIPSWAKVNTKYISLRCLNTPPMQSLYKKIGHPFFTTSLNLQGEPPILSEVEAKQFRSQHCPNSIMVEGQNEILSGVSSTMIFINDHLDFEIKREGRKISELKNHLRQLKLD